ncbi:MAG: DUF512 domain-containing protein [Chordicoccus sp.]
MRDSRNLGHEIKSVKEGSIAWEMGVEPGMYVVEVNGHELKDVFDYQYYMEGESVTVLIREKSGEETLLEIEKEENEDFGVEFVSPLMDDYRHCSNNCVFCFIDQMPPGMRDTLYFKDDDSRLSFLQGNYVTLTNMSDEDIDRIIRFRLEPINVSVQTTNPELRVRMLHNRFAGTALQKMKRLKDAGIAMNGQIVLCKGWNDGEELNRTIRDLTAYLPEMQSVSVVPVGLSKFRKGLARLEPFTKEDAGAVIDLIESWQKKIWNELAASYVPEEGEVVPDLLRGAPRHFIHASDEWYILAGRPLPPAEQYDGFVQYENGVGMLRLLQMEVDAAIEKYRAVLAGEAEDTGSDRIDRHSRVWHRDAEDEEETDEVYFAADSEGEDDESTLSGGTEERPAASRPEEREELIRAVSTPRRVTSVTGRLADPYIRELAGHVEKAFPGHALNVVPIRNDFFGEMITVAGLVTGQDMIRQLKERQAAGEDLGSAILVPITMLKRGEKIFLDDLSTDDVERETGLPVRVVEDSGEDFVRAQLGLKPVKKEERQLYE